MHLILDFGQIITLNNKNMATWNYLVDIWIQEQTATQAKWEAPYFLDINNLTAPKINTSDTPEYEKWGLQNQEELDLMKYVKETWWTAEDFTFVLEDFRTKTEPDFTNVLETPKEEWALATFWWWVENIVWWAISQAPSILKNVAWFATDVADFMLPLDNILEVVTWAEKWTTLFDLWWLADQFRADWIESKEQLQSVLWTDPEAFTTKIWEFWAEVLSLFIPWWQAGLATKFPKLAESIPVLTKWLTNLELKAPKVFNTLKNTLQSSLKWAEDLWKFEIVSEWEVTPTWLAIWAVAWPLLTWIWAAWKWIINKFWWARSVDEVAWNILQPTWKFGSLNFEWAKQWLVSAINKLTWKEVKTIADYKTLSTTLNKEKAEVFKPLKEWLDKIKTEYKDTSVTQAIDWLVSVLEWQPWKKFTKLLDEVKLLSEKNANKWLTLSEIQRVKLLHTQNNKLFTETWKDAAWVSSEALREVRKDLKKLIEDKAKAEWFKDVAKINTEYSNLLDAENLIQVQLWRLTNFLGREWKQSFLQNVTEFAMNLPWIKQWLKQPLETIFKNIWASLKAWKIDPIRVEEQLPSLLKELRAAWIPEKEIWTIMQNMVNTLKLLTWIWAKEILDINKE